MNAAQSAQQQTSCVSSSRTEHGRCITKRLKHELGLTVCGLLEDPTVVVIMLNPDGRLWAERLGKPMEPCGHMPASQAKSLIGTVASTVPTQITAQNPILECELPLDDSLFAASIPPVVSSPTFTIRKKAVSIFTLHDCVEKGTMMQEQCGDEKAAVRNHNNVLVVEETGTGKTTLASEIIFSGCDPTVAKAVRQFLERWGPYSKESKGYHINRLVSEVVDPAVADFLSRLPERLSGLLIPINDFTAMLHHQKYCLQMFSKFANSDSLSDQSIIATFDTLIELIWSCVSKKPKRTRPRKTTKARDSKLMVNGQRPKMLCEFCSKPTELSTFIQQGVYSYEDDDPDGKARLSSKYCPEHRPKHWDGTWNEKYRQAMRTKKQFELELKRLTKQSASPATLHTRSGDIATDLYIFNYVARQALQPADENELRQQARKMVEVKLSDRKKRIVMMLASGHNQSDIAKKLGISRQAVSKALSSIPAEFRLDRS